MFRDCYLERRRWQLQQQLSRFMNIESSNFIVHYHLHYTSTCSPSGTLPFQCIPQLWTSKFAIAIHCVCNWISCGICLIIDIHGFPCSISCHTFVVGEMPKVGYTHYAFRLRLPSFRMPLYKEKSLQENTS